MARRGENIYKRADGRYEGRYIKSYNINGKAVYGYVYARSYAEVKDNLIKFKINSPHKPSGSATLLSKWLNLWIETAEVKESTRQLYRRHIQNHIEPQIGKKPLKKLSAEVLQEFVSNLQLAPSTVRLIFTILKSALMYAEDKGYITNINSKVVTEKVYRKNMEYPVEKLKQMADYLLGLYDTDAENLHKMFGIPHEERQKLKAKQLQNSEN